MDDEITVTDLDFILQSLEYSKLKIESTLYPDYSLRRQEIERIETLMRKVKRLREDIKGFPSQTL